MEIYEACKEGNVLKFQNILNKNTQFIDWDLALDYSCRSGNIKMVDTILNKYTFNNSVTYNFWPYEEVLNTCLYRACFLGHYEIVKLLLGKLLLGKGSYNLNEHLYSACRGGHIDIIDLMIEKGANNYTWAILGALEKNNLDIVDYLIFLGADFEIVDFKYQRIYLLHRLYLHKYKIYKDINNLYLFLKLNDDIKSKISYFCIKFSTYK